MRPETTSYDRGRKRTCTFVPLAVHTLQHAHRDCNERARAFPHGRRLGRRHEGSEAYSLRRDRGRWADRARVE